MVKKNGRLTCVLSQVTFPHPTNVTFLYLFFFLLFLDEKYYSIYDVSVMRNYSFRPKCNINLVQFIKIQQQEKIINCRYYFLNATELTISYFC